MKTATGLALVAIGAILAFAVKGHPSFLNIQIVGWVIILTGVAGMLIPRRGYGWMRRRMVLRRGPAGLPVVHHVEEKQYPPYIALNSGAAIPGTTVTTDITEPGPARRPPPARRRSWSPRPTRPGLCTRMPSSGPRSGRRPNRRPRSVRSPTGRPRRRPPRPASRARPSRWSRSTSRSRPRPVRARVAASCLAAEVRLPAAPRPARPAWSCRPAVHRGRTQGQAPAPAIPGPRAAGLPAWPVRR